MDIHHLYQIYFNALFDDLRRLIVSINQMNDRSLKQDQNHSSIQIAKNHLTNIDMISAISKNTIFDMYARIAHNYFLRMSNEGDKLQNSSNPLFQKVNTFKMSLDQQLMSICAFQVQTIRERVLNRLIQEDNQSLLDQQLKILIEESNNTEFCNNDSFDALNSNGLLNDNESTETEAESKQHLTLKPITNETQKQNDAKMYLNYFKGPGKPNEYDQIKDKHLVQFLYPKTLITLQNQQISDEAKNRNSHIYDCANKMMSPQSTVESTQEMTYTKRKNPFTFKVFKKASMYPTARDTNKRKITNKFQESTENAKISTISCDQISLRESSNHKKQLLPHKDRKVSISKDNTALKKHSFMKNKSQEKRVGEHITLLHRMNKIQRKIMNKVPLLSKMGVKFSKLA